MRIVHITAVPVEKTAAAEHRTQVLGLAIGLSAKDLGLKRHFVGVNLKEAELCQE